MKSRRLLKSLQVNTHTHTHVNEFILPEIIAVRSPPPFHPILILMTFTENTIYTFHLYDDSRCTFYFALWSVWLRTQFAK